MPSISSESLTEGGAGDEDEEAALEGAPRHRHRERGDRETGDTVVVVVWRSVALCLSSIASEAR